MTKPDTSEKLANKASVPEEKKIDTSLNEAQVDQSRQANHPLGPTANEGFWPEVKWIEPEFIKQVREFGVVLSVPVIDFAMALLSITAVVFLIDYLSLSKSMQELSDKMNIQFEQNQLLEAIA